MENRNSLGWKGSGSPNAGHTADCRLWKSLQNLTPNEEQFTHDLEEMLLITGISRQGYLYPISVTF